MGMTLAEKIIARAAGADSVRPGDIVTCAVDLAMMHDSSGPRRIKPKLEQLGVRPWNPDKIVIVTDHYVTEDTDDARAIQDLTRDWVKAEGVTRYHERQGICHIILPEKGHLRPGMFVVGADSHSTTAGAFGVFMIGIGSTEITGVLATGEIWVRVPQTLRVEAAGRLADGVAAKDIMLMLCGRIGIMGANYKAVEYAGPAVDAMGIQERMVLTNMSAELGAKTGIIAADGVTTAALAGFGVEVTDADAWRSDPGAEVEDTIPIDAAALAPQVAAPHSPENASPVGDHQGTAVDQAYIGACTGAKLDDLRMAARIVRGRTVAIPLYVAPASVATAEQARGDGTLKVLEDAGAAILESACGACIGLGPARLGEGESGISSSSRNFRARMGERSSKTFLASPYTVAATAIAGHITDPRDILAETRL
jgi:3-isopropylmalate/(R)-2-methylmalate dehydratase large subunit